MSNIIKTILYAIVGVALLAFSLYSGYTAYQSYSSEVTTPQTQAITNPVAPKQKMTPKKTPPVTKKISMEESEKLLASIGNEMTDTAIYLGDSSKHKKELDSSRAEVDKILSKLMDSDPSKVVRLQKKLLLVREKVDSKALDYYALLSSNYANSILAGAKNMIFALYKPTDPGEIRNFRNRLNSIKYAYLERSLVAYKLESKQTFDKSEQSKWLRKAKRLSGTPLTLNLTDTTSAVNVNRNKIINTQAGAGMDTDAWLSDYNKAISRLNPLFSTKMRQAKASIPKPVSTATKKSDTKTIQTDSTKTQQSNDYLPYAIYSLLAGLASILYFTSIKYIGRLKKTTPVTNSKTKKEKRSTLFRKNRKSDVAFQTEQTVLEPSKAPAPQETGVTVQYENPDEIVETSTQDSTKAYSKTIIKEPYIMGQGNKDEHTETNEPKNTTTETITSDIQEKPSDLPVPEVTNIEQHLSTPSTELLSAETEPASTQYDGLKQELSRVIATNDKDKIYEFLSKTIQDSNKAKDLFLASMSHEIRTPLSGIVGFTELLKSTNLTADQKEFVDVIEDSSDNLLVIVNDILDLSKIQADKMEVESIPFKCREKFESSIEPHAIKASQKNIDFSLYIDPSIPDQLLGDSTKITQILTNLISNAIKFTKDGGDVDVHIENISQSNETALIRFAVKDTGIGISAEEQQKIFNDFTQAQVSTSRQFGGTGLGLAISSRLVKLMGGELRLESSLGEGSQFYFDLELPIHSRAADIKKEINAGLVITNNALKQSDRNLKAYIDYLGGNLIFLSEHNIETGMLPEIIFVDQKLTENYALMSKLEISNRHIVVIANGGYKPKETANICSIIKPVNLTKLLSIIDKTKLTQVITNDHIDTVKTLDTAPINRDFEGKTALVIEDNLINQKLIDNVLSALGFTVTLANNGKEGLETRMVGNFDVIFMDVQMPIMDGLTATKEILSFEARNQKKHIPIIALTANATDTDESRCLDAGMDAYIPKPIGTDKIKKTLTSLLTDAPTRDNIMPNNIVTNTEPIPKIQEQQTVPSTKERVLICKRSPLLRSVYRKIVENQGYIVDTASNEEEFLDHMYKNQYKLVFVDEEMSSKNSKLIATNLIKEFGSIPMALDQSKNYTNEEFKEMLNYSKKD